MCDSTYNNRDSPQVSLRECGNIYIFTCIFFSNKIAMNCLCNCISFKDFKLVDRLNKYGFCLKKSMKYTIQEEMGKHFMAKHL